MVSIPAGSFLMGNSGIGDDKKYSMHREHPRHSVTLSAYSIGKYEVTRGHYRAFINTGGYSTQSYWSADGWDWKIAKKLTEPALWAAKQSWKKRKSFIQTDNHPVIGVSYFEAEAFCNWAGGHLPTEAQWERAARWDSTAKYANVYPWGDVWDVEKCNNQYDHNSAGGGYEAVQTAPVGSYPAGASPCGCQDMAGNVWEWCKDWYGDKYYSESPASDPQGPASGLSRILRGGSYQYIYVDNYSRCASRNANAGPYSYSNDYGFRLVR